MSAAPPALQEVLRYPLLTALRERRTRRVARDASVPAGDISFEIPNAPVFSRQAESEGKWRSP